MDKQIFDQDVAAQQSAFLEAFKEFGHDGAAAAIVDITVSEVEKWKEVDEQFLAMYDDAYQYFSGTLVKEAITRARDGWDEPIVHRGEVQYLKDPETGQPILDDDLVPIPATIRKKSDGLLKMALRANLEEYKPNSKVEVTGVEGEPLVNNITVEFITSKEQLEQEEQLKQEESLKQEEQIEDLNHG